MKPIFHNNRLLIFFILAAVGTGVLAVALPPDKTQAPKEYETIKAKALEQVLKDDKGNPIISKDSVQQYLLFEADDYQISYQKAYDLFLISINASPFNDIREKAEKQFLALLDDNAEAACFFRVETTTPFFANPDLSGQQFPLSFCTP